MKRVNGFNCHSDELNENYSNELGLRRLALFVSPLSSIRSMFRFCLKLPVSKEFFGTYRGNNAPLCSSRFWHYLNHGR